MYSNHTATSLPRNGSSAGPSKVTAGVSIDRPGRTRSELQQNALDVVIEEGSCGTAWELQPQDRVNPVPAACCAPIPRQSGQNSSTPAFLRHKAMDNLRLLSRQTVSINTKSAEFETWLRSSHTPQPSPPGQLKGRRKRQRRWAGGFSFDSFFITRAARANRLPSLRCKGFAGKSGPSSYSTRCVDSFDPPTMSVHLRGLRRITIQQISACLFAFYSPKIPSAKTNFLDSEHSPWH